MLLAKQLAYFERYGKLYLGDRSVLSDKDFFRGVLESTLDAHELPREQQNATTMTP